METKRNDNIDLRSDTVTAPSPGMRAAMANARVGDDVFGEDPTVNALQERSAKLLGTESALFVPSGSMANQIAILAHTRPGDDVIIGAGGHSYLYEGGAGGAVAGVQFTLVGDDGLFDRAHVQAAIKADNVHLAPTTLVMAENTHNRSGGRIFPIEKLRNIRALADARGLGFHIDGARLLNASVATDTSPQAFGKIAHSLSLCFSKGLGAPVGSVLAGSTDFIVRAHRYRKMLGGAMRQAGILAAGAIYALENNIQRLANDHRRARKFAAGVANIDEFEIALETVQTNIVVFQVSERAGFDAAAVQEAAEAAGLRMFALGPNLLRAVFHKHISDDGVKTAIDTLKSVCVSLRS